MIGFVVFYCGLAQCFCSGLNPSCKNIIFELNSKQNMKGGCIKIIFKTLKLGYPPRQTSKCIKGRRQ